MYLQSKTNRGKIDTSYLVCIFFFFSVLPKYKNFVAHYWYSYSWWNFAYKDAIVWQQTSVVHLKQICCGPSRPGWDPAQAHKCRKSTRLSACASVKTALSTRLTKPGARKEKAEREAPFSGQQQLEDTRQTQRKGLQIWLTGQRTLFTCSCPVSL